MIVVPIHSPGGDTSELSKILTTIDEVRTGSMGAKFRFTRHGMGSKLCLYSLFVWNKAYMSSNGKLMCHEPSLSGREDGGISAEKASKMAVSLVVQLEIYLQAEYPCSSGF